VIAKTLATHVDAIALAKKTEKDAGAAAAVTRFLATCG